jgi:hypothetical protein
MWVVLRTLDLGRCDEGAACFYVRLTKEDASIGVYRCFTAFRTEFHSPSPAHYAKVLSEMAGI